ncbi:MAG TPA: FAD:protein FMN transferase [Acidimicrobiales bacterium]|jgi:thiamine biosynthesis lipoprotein
MLAAPRSAGRLLYRTSALGTRAELLVTDPEVLTAAARLLHRELERIDRIASRFRPDSEVRQLQRAAGRVVEVSEGLLEAVTAALRAAAATDGAVDPTVGAALCRLGYDRDFSQVAPGVPGRLPRPQRAPGWRSVKVDPVAHTIRLPVGVQLDLGATAKALAADRAAASIHRSLGCGVLVSLGGDVATAGAPPQGFSVALGESCQAPDSPEQVGILAGGLATSGTGVRQWRLGRDLVHHLVEPSTGLPVVPVWRTVSVCAATCVDANAGSTAAMVKGAGAPQWLESQRLPSRLVAADGTRCFVAGWPHDARPDDERPAPRRRRAR